MNTYHDFVNGLKEDELMILLELVSRTYNDGNLYEWFTNITDLNPEAYRGTFEKIVGFMGGFLDGGVDLRTETGLEECYGCSTLSRIVAYTANSLGVSRGLCQECADSGEFDLHDIEEFADDWGDDNDD